MGLGNRVADRAHGCALRAVSSFCLHSAYMLGGTGFLLPGTELPQPWAACCPARTLAPLGFTHTTQCLHTDIFIKLKKVLVSCFVGYEAELCYLGGKKRSPGAVKISQACKIRRAACSWEVEYLQKWKNSKTEIIHFHCTVCPPTIKKILLFTYFLEYVIVLEEHFMLLL